MTLNDPELAEIVRKGERVEIDKKLFTVHQSEGGKCDGCYFQDKVRCPVRAVTYCTSNRGNILKIVNK